MSKFRIQPHGRLQEWVAEEKGYFKDAGLDYEFVHGRLLGPRSAASEQSGSEGGGPADIRSGAFETMEEGRACEISSACHWAVSHASALGHGLMWGHAYSITPSGIYVPPESSIRNAADLAGVTVGVGYHSGSHFTTLQALEKLLEPDEINLRFVGGPNDRLPLLLDRKVPAATLFGTQLYVLEQQGFRKVVDTTFMIGFLFTADADLKDVERYFNALQQAQREIDRDPGLYKHYYLRELPERYHGMIDIQAFGPGERLVFEPYTREMYEDTHRWMASWKLFPEADRPEAAYDAVVVV